MRVALRTDASSQIGSGHVIRCLTLADALRQHGAECQFACREQEGHLMDHIRSSGYEVHPLVIPSENSSFTSELAHAHWLGVDWQTDAEETRQALGSHALDWLIVDHYALDHRWESVLRSSCKRIMVIDDLADRRHDCDFLLDQNFGSSALRYRCLVPTGCTQCHGPEYALLKPVYAQRRAEQSVRIGKIEHVLIYFGGGADPMNLTGMALHAFQAPELNEVDIDIVVGSGYAHKAELEAAAINRGKTFINTQLPDLSELMAKADLAIGAGGATTWERCCLGLPTVVISTANNQLPACQALAAEDAIEYLGHLNNITIETLTEAILHLLRVPEKLELYSQNCCRLVDGRGIEKVVEYLCKQD